MKKFLSVAGLFVIYFVLVFGCEFLGFVSPLLWVYYSVLAGLLAATPFMAFASKSTRIGVVALFPILYLVIMLIIGEVSQPICGLMFVAVCILAEVIRRLISSGKQLALRLSYSMTAVAYGMLLLPLWTKTAWYYEGAVEEMGSQAYADALMCYATPFGLISQVVLTFAAGYIGALIAEKIFKNRVIVSE